MRDAESQYLSAMLNFTPFYFQDGQSNMSEEHRSIITELKGDIYRTNCSNIYVHLHTHCFSFLFFYPEHLFWIECYWALPIAKTTHQHNLTFTLILSAGLQACYMSVSCYTVLWGNAVLHCSALEGQFAPSRQSVSSPGCAVLSGVSWDVSEALLEK